MKFFVRADFGHWVLHAKFLAFTRLKGAHCVSVFTNLRKIELKKGLHSIQVHTVVHHVPKRKTPVKGLSLTILALK